MGDVSPRDYYDRQLRVPGWGTAGQQALGRATVLVVGVGGLGCPVLGALARSGVGHLMFCDPDVVEASNLPRQTLFSPADVGRSKAEVAAKALRTANPWISLTPVARSVNETNVRSLVEQADLVVDGTDTFAAKFLLHDACRAAHKPLVTASLYQWEAQVTVFPFHSGLPGCWRCLYTEAPVDGCVGVCADVGVAGALAGMAGNYQALLALRLLLGQSVPEACSTLVFDLESDTPRRLRWKPDPTCSCSRPADWSFLDTRPVRLEASWDELLPSQRQVVVDLREPMEIDPSEWEWFEAQGSRVVHARWADWKNSQPAWDPATSYVLVCARGIRSLAAVQTLPPEICALSLKGGIPL